MTDRSELEALAAKVGVFYHDGKASLGAPLYAFTPTELRELARRLQPARVPEGWTEDRLRAEAKARGWYTREGTSVPTADGDWRHPFDVTIPSRDLCALLSAAPAAEGGMADPVAWQLRRLKLDGKWTEWEQCDQGMQSHYQTFKAANPESTLHYEFRALGVIANPAPESREAPKCETCSGQGEVGGFAGMYNGFETHPCPDCVSPAKPEAGQRDGVEDGREQFEAWASSFPNPMPLKRAGVADRYTYATTDAAWRAWQEARRLASAQQAGIVGDEAEGC